MAPVVARAGTYVRLDIEEKLQIITFMENNPKELFSKVGFFGDRLNKNINKMHVSQIKRKISNDVDKSPKNEGRYEIRKSFIRAIRPTAR